MKKSKKTEITVSKIMEAAMKEFGKNGYAGGTINNICNAGINKGLIYHNFSGKDELYLACLKRSCDTFLRYFTKNGGTYNPGKYMDVRMNFFSDYPDEAHIFFDSLLNPPAHLSKEIGQALEKFNALNEEMYGKTLNSITLREGISKEDATAYFHLLQVMLNGYFSSPAFQNMDLREKTEIHEMIVPKLFDCMLYGIAEEKPQ